MKRGWRLGRNEADTAFCVEPNRRFGRAPSLTPGRVESSAFIPDPESASENRSQSEPERLREGLERLVPGAAGCWVGMTTAQPPGGRQARDPRGDAVRGRIKRKAEEAAGRGLHPSRPSQPVRGAKLRPRQCTPECGEAPEPNDGTQRDSGLGRSLLAPGGSLTC